MAGTADAILMVEAGADELPEDLMLEALRLGHEAMQPIIELQERMRAELGKAKFEYVALAGPTRRSKRPPQAGSATGCDDILAAAAREAGTGRSQARPMKELRLADRPGRDVRAEGAAHGLRQRREEGRARAHPGREDPPGRARLQGDSPDQRRGGHPAPRARQRPLHPRRDAGADRRDARHARRRAEAGHPGTPKSPSATCTTTTSRPSRPARWPRTVAPSAARSGTARWPSGRWSR